MLNFHNSYYANFFLFMFVALINQFIVMHIEILIRYKSPAGFLVDDYVSEKRLKQLFLIGICKPSDYILQNWFRPFCTPDFQRFIYRCHHFYNIGL